MQQGPGYGGVPGPRRRRRAVWPWVLVAAAVVAVAVLAFLAARPDTVEGSAVAADGSDDVRISRLVQEFALAVTNEDVEAITGLMCPEEARQFEDAVVPDPAAPAAEPVSEIEPVQVTDVRLAGDAASALVTSNEQVPPQPMGFQRLDGQWRVCSSAAGEGGR